MTYQEYFIIFDFKIYGNNWTQMWVINVLS